MLTILPMTNITLVRLFLGMDYVVLIQTRVLGESLPAVLNGTNVRLFSRVNTYVVLVVR